MLKIFFILHLHKTTSTIIKKPSILNGENRSILNKESNEKINSKLIPCSDKVRGFESNSFK